MTTSDSRRAEQALRQSEQRYRALFDAIDEGFCVIEMLYDDDERPVDYRFVEVNSAFESHTGLSDAEGKRMKALAPKHEQHWFDIYGRIGLTGNAERFVQAAQHLGDRWFDVYAFRIGEPEARHVGVLFRDISERKRMEQQLVESDRMKTEFLAILGHELRNPLAPLQTGLDLMEQSPRGAELGDRVFPMMRRQLSHLVRLVDDLVDMSRISRGKIELRKETLDLGVPVHAAIEQVQPMIERRRHRLLLELTGRPLVIHGDVERLTQIVVNLLANAATYSDAGGTITVVTGSERGEAFVSVRDTGYGIAAADLDKVFEFFSQVAEHQRRDGGGGLGIGLAIARRLVEMHGGAIEARSEGLERGSEFVVRLPLSAVDEDRRPGARGDGRGEPARRVLVVDDNVDAAEGLQMLLELKGHAVEAVHDGPAALRAVAEFSPELVLLDLGLPGMDGFEIARRIRSRPAGGAIRIVAVTGWGQDEDKASTRQVGFDDHLIKPVDAADLDALLTALD